MPKKRIDDLIRTRWLLAFLALLLVLAPTVTLAQSVAVANPRGTTKLGIVTKLIDAQTVNATATVSSSAYDLTQSLFFGAWYQCVSASGTPNVDIVFRQGPGSPDDPVAVTIPSAAFVQTLVIHDDLVDEDPHIATLAPPPMRYGQVRVVGNAGNPTDTVCDVWLFTQGGRP